MREQVPEREMLGTSSETAYMEFPNTQVKTLSKEPMSGVPKPYKEQKKQVEQRYWNQLDNSLLLLIKEI